MIGNREVVRIAALEAGTPVPRRVISVPVLYLMGALESVRAWFTGSDERVTIESVRLMRAEVDCTKAQGGVGLVTAIG